MKPAEDAAIAAVLETQLHGQARQTIAWFAALLAGTANDVIFTALPPVDNFWQAQARATAAL